MVPSILLIAPEPAAQAVAQLLRSRLDATVEIVAHGRTGLSVLRREDFSLVLLEENLASAEPDATEALFAGAGTAPVLELNFGLCSADRVLRQVRSALQRRAQDERKAHRAAVATLHHELNASVAGLLLESQLAVRQAGPEVLPSLQRISELAAELREHLRA